MKSWGSFLVVVGLWILDRITKLWILHNLALYETREVFPFFNINHVRNTGVAFGLGQNFNAVFIVIAIILTGVLLLWHRKERAHLGMRIALSLLIAGALGNIYDRIAYGYVVDFLDFHAFGSHWPSFNVADSAVSIGALLLLWFTHRSQSIDPAVPRQ